MTVKKKLTQHTCNQYNYYTRMLRKDKQLNLTIGEVNVASYLHLPKEVPIQFCPETR